MKKLNTAGKGQNDYVIRGEGEGEASHISCISSPRRPRPLWKHCRHWQLQSWS